MLSSASPALLPIPFANNAGGGYVRPIPTPSQTGVQAGAASLYDGFPPLTQTPIATGGIPPFGQDMNGILKWLSQINQWQQAGGPIVFNSTFATAIGGYPKGAVLQAGGLGGGFWRSTVENNVANPDGSGAGWASFFAPVFVDPTFSGTMTSGGPAVFADTVNLGAQATAGTQAQGDNSTRVANTAYADRAATNAYNAAAAHADSGDAAVLAKFPGSSNYRDVNGTRFVWFDTVTVTGVADIVDWPVTFGGTPYGYSVSENDPGGGWGAGANPTIYAIGSMNAAQFRLWGTRYAAGTFAPQGGLSCHIIAWGPTP